MRHLTEEHKRKIGDAQRGRPRLYLRGANNPMKREENKNKISKALIGIKRSLETIDKARLKNIGRKTSKETRLKQSLAQKKIVASGQHHLWKGGLTRLHRSERNFIEQTIEYKLWRLSIFERDDFTCQICFGRGGKLHADHIKPFALFPELRTELSNGRTLCQECHRKTETYGGRIIVAKAT